MWEQINPSFQYQLELFTRSGPLLETAQHSTVVQCLLKDLQVSAVLCGRASHSERIMNQMGAGLRHLDVVTAIPVRLVQSKRRTVAYIHVH